MSDDFYRNLPSFSNFRAIAQFSDYQDFPLDWVVLLSDVEGSTQAIERDEYKSVNMIGAAAIPAVLNACGDITIPYVFGGDGATLVVPGSLADAATAALAGLQNHSQSMFGLGLRIAAVPLRDIYEAGLTLRVRKFELSPGNFLAMFTGDGLARCEQWLKDPAPNRYRLMPGESCSMPPPDLTGLSCRWKPLMSKNGAMMSIIIQPSAEEGDTGTAAINQILDRLVEIVGGRLGEAAPANDQSLKFTWPPPGLRLEAKAISAGTVFWRCYATILLESFIQFLSELFGIKAGRYDPQPYRRELMSNTDFRKYDGMLRLTLDVTAQQADDIDTFLEGQFLDGQLTYGCHRSDHALMTCLVFSLEDKEHVHFVDAADGGFALAAKGFKARLSQ